MLENISYDSWKRVVWNGHIRIEWIIARVEPGSCGGEVRSSHLIEFKKYDYKYIFHYIKCAK
jgi:hypothetical protein